MGAKFAKLGWTLLIYPVIGMIGHKKSQALVAGRTTHFLILAYLLERLTVYR